MKLRLCPFCGSSRLRGSKEHYETRRAGRKIVIPRLEIYRCPACGQAFLTDEAMKEIERTALRRGHAA